jgi:hypothetical protein
MALGDGSDRLPIGADLRTRLGKEEEDSVEITRQGRLGR